MEVLNISIGNESVLISFEMNLVKVKKWVLGL